MNQYLFTHLKEYPKPTQADLHQYYNRLYAEAKMWAEKEISLGFVLT